MPQKKKQGQGGILQKKSKKIKKTHGSTQQKQQAPDLTYLKYDATANEFTVQTPRPDNQREPANQKRIAKYLEKKLKGDAQRPYEVRLFLKSIKNKKNLSEMTGNYKKLDINGLEICHVVSIHEIKTIYAGGLNKYLKAKNNTERQEVVDKIKEYADEFLTSGAEDIKEVKTSIDKAFVTPPTLQSRLSIKALLKRFNKSRANLRPGDPTYNHSISKKRDPFFKMRKTKTDPQIYQPHVDKRLKATDKLNQFLFKAKVQKQFEEDEWEFGSGKNKYIEIASSTNTLV
ncbi:MAG: hypothetical protein NXI16_04700 [Alphaproteobacteria bacterium]|nr:hypothetical protein [Alphaproteobacteria bacterium]